LRGGGGIGAGTSATVAGPTSSMSTVEGCLTPVAAATSMAMMTAVAM
jgi:hypothetical protein